jgi:hypothetical protein
MGLSQLDQFECRQFLGKIDDSDFRMTASGIEITLFLHKVYINPYPANVDKMVGSCQC